SYSVLIIIVSALDSELDRITGITLGSDDYLVKPFSPVELVARVKALFRRVDLDRKVVSADILVVGDMRINVKSRDCWIDQKKVDLTPTEIALLTYMFQHADQAVSRQQLLKHVWGVEWDADTRATDDILKRLRKKLVDSRVKVESVWGFGFRLVVEDEHEKSEK
ncbi:MAG: response regulator transcription factor, partial [Erysipelotrichaceae bacterium]|nr:response regulator transcription factor [Erysipelotrichaceae bacterium]